MYGRSLFRARGMRRTAFALMLALLLPTVLPFGGLSGKSSTVPLNLFGGDAARAWEAPGLIVEVYYRALRADEYVVVANPLDEPLDLTGWTITDGEGTLTFPVGSAASSFGKIVVARNSTAYFEDTLHSADFQYGFGTVSPIGIRGSFQLNNDGDEVILRDGQGNTMDVLAYGLSPYGGPGWTGPTAGHLGQGEVAHRALDSGWRDSNSSADWDLVRVRSLGQSDFLPAAFTFSGNARAFATPDAQASALRDLLDGARTSLDASLYTFTNSALLSPLLAAIARGVRVRILLEGAPAGGIDTREWSILRALAGSTDIRFLVDNATLDIQERYRFGHAKYAILDSSTVVVSTENWGDSAFPTGATIGSRGWVVAVDHPPLAAYFTAVFEEDFDDRRRDVFRLEEMAIAPVWRPREDVESRSPSFGQIEVSGPFRVIPVIGPDTSLSDATILGVLGGASERICAELFYAHAVWGPFPNLYLEALIGAARRGVTVRLLLDSSTYNTEDDDAIDNDDTVAYVNSVAAREGLDLQAKLIDLRLHSLSRLHAKGFVVDGRWTLVSSINWNRNSPTANREAGLLIENRDLAVYFDAVFAWDWKDNFVAPFADAGPDRNVAIGDIVAFDGLGSFDDEAIVNWSWDLDGDASDDAWGAEVSYAYLYVGMFAVRLRVRDAWGNTAEDRVQVLVHVARAVSTGIPGSLFVLAILGIVILFAVVRRSRQRLSKPP